MKIGEIVSLLKAGYTKAEIAELRAAESATAEPEVPSVPVSPASAAGSAVAPETPPAPEAAPAAKEPDPDIQELKNLVSNLTKLIQKQNLQQAELHPPTPQTAVDILGSVINPPKR